MNTIGPSVESLVEQAWKLKGDIDIAEIRLKEVKKKLVEIAREKRGKENTVRIDGRDVAAVIRFGQTTSYDSRRLLDVLMILKNRRFSKLFSTATVYRALPGLKKFLEAKGNVAAKRAIAEAMKVTDNAPKLTFEEAASS